LTLCLAVVGLTLVSFAAVAPKIYRWVDANGTTHYTTTPPPAGEAREARELPRGAPSPAVAPSGWEEKELEFRRRRLEAETANAQEE